MENEVEPLDEMVFPPGDELDLQRYREAGGMYKSEKTNIWWWNSFTNLMIN